MNWIAITSLAVVVSCCCAQESEEWIEDSPNPESSAEWLSRLEADPLDLDIASAEDLDRLPAFDRNAADELIRARGTSRGFASVAEAAALPFLTAAQRRSLRRFATVTRPSGARHSVCLLASGRETSDQSGVQRVRLDAEASNGKDHRGRVLALRQDDENQVRRTMSVSMEFRSDRLPIRVVAGDYQWEFGTGLMLGTSYGLSNWLAERSRVSPSSPRGVIPGTTSQRTSVWRGAAVEMKRNPVTATVAADMGRMHSAALDESGPSSSRILWMSPDFEESEASARVQTIAAGSSVTHGFIRVGACGMQLSVSDELGATNDATEAPAPAKRHVRGGSLFGSVLWRGLNATGEASASNGGGEAHQASFSFGGDRMDLGVFSVYSSADYVAPRGRLWSRFEEINRNYSSTGIRLGSRAGRHRLAATAQLSRSSESDYDVWSSGSAGTFEAQDEFSISPALTLTLTGVQSWRPSDTDGNDADDRRTDRIRADLAIREPDRFRVCGELRGIRQPDGSREDVGTLLFCQSHLELPLRIECFTRLTYFHLEGEHLRAVLYENSLPGAYPLVNLSGSGRRIAVLLRREWHGFGVGVKVQSTATTGSSGRRERHELLLGISHKG